MSFDRDFTRCELRIRKCTLSYQKDNSDQSELLEHTHGKNQTVISNIWEVVLSDNCITLMQSGRTPKYQSNGLVLDSPRWTITFDIEKISNLLAKEFKDERNPPTIEMLFDSLHPPTKGFGCVEPRDPTVREPKEDEAYTSGEDGPGPPQSYPLAKFAENYTGNGIKRIKMSFLRQDAKRGGLLWARPDQNWILRLKQIKTATAEDIVMRLSTC